MIRRGFAMIVMLLVVTERSLSAAPGYGEPLDKTTGTIYRVGTATALINAVDTMNAAGVPATILISNGTYVLDVWALPVTCNHVIIRGASGQRDAVILRGPDEGESASLEHVFWVTASDVLIADLTFGWCRYHGIQNHGQEPYNASGLWVHNCRIVNCNEQFIKGTSETSDPEGVTDGIIENCLFEFTNRWAYQYYTGGIDIHKGVNWTVRDNLFRDIRATDGMAEHAIHFWNRCATRPQNVVAERNIIINCDRGIGFGLSSYAGGHNGGSSVIRNNTVYNNGLAPNADVGIGLEYACNVQVDNNTVYVPYWAPVEYRFSGSSNLVFRNNLVQGNITARDGAPAPSLSNNVASVQPGWFRGLTNGDLHVLPGATNAIDRGVTIAGFGDDLDGHTRPALSAWDIGADEYDPARTDSDSDLMLDAWEVGYKLNPTNAADATLDPDDDTFSNVEEYMAGTNPTNASSFFQWLEVSRSLFSNDWKILKWPGASGRVYAISTTTNIMSVGFTAITSGLAATSAMNIWTDQTSRGSALYYQLRVTLP
ncbi:MAG: right-handed parallel beta-helix repeat-containing protein [Lentisphaerota bacterium]